MDEASKQRYMVDDLSAKSSDVAQKLSETAMAAGTVIGHRVALGVEAMRDPMGVDHTEFTRMGTEKIAAFTQSGAEVMGDLQGIQQEILRYSLGQTQAALATVLSVSTAYSPMAAFTAQQKFIFQSVSRFTEHATRLTKMTSALPGTAIDPVHSVATDNARRLGTKRKGDR